MGKILSLIEEKIKAFKGEPIKIMLKFSTQQELWKQEHIEENLKHGEIVREIFDLPFEVTDKVKSEDGIKII